MTLSQKMPMRWRLGIVLLISTLSLIFIGTVGFLSIQAVNRSVTSLTAQTIPLMDDITDLEKILKDCQIGLLELTLPGISDDDIEKTFNRTKANLQDFDSRLKQFRTKNQESAEGIEKSWSEAETEIQQSLELVISGSAANREAFADRYRQRILQLQQTIQDALEKAARDTAAKSLAERDEAAELTQGSQRLMLGIPGFLLVFIAISGLLLIRNIDQALHGIMGHVQTHSHEVYASAKGVDGLSQSLDVGAQETSKSLQVCVDNLSEITAMVNRSSENADRSMQLASLAHEASTAGNQAVAQIADAMRDIEKTTDDFVQIMEAGAKDVMTIETIFRDVTEKTRLINDIVFQTKLLSFNASVEAARAGEAGKGFAVVAEEVGKLSHMTGDVATEISRLLAASSEQVKSIGQRIQTTTAAVRGRATAAVSNGTSRVSKGREHLNAIVQHSNDVKFNVEQISAAAREQSQAVEEISNTLHQLRSVADRNAGKAHDSNDIAHKLLASAATMEDTVTHLQDFLDGRSQHRDAQPAPADESAAFYDDDDDLPKAG